MEERTIKDANGKEITLEKVSASDNEDGNFLSPMHAEIVLRKLRNAQQYDYVRRVMVESYPGCKRDDVPRIVESLKAFDKRGIGCAFDDPIRYAQVIDWVDEWKDESTGQRISDYAKQILIQRLETSIMPNDKIQLLIEELQNISAGDLNRFWFKRFRIGNIMDGKAFFELCQKVVPWRTEKKWNYENFKKGGQK